MSDQQPADPRPGFYYVTAIDGPRYARVLGPFVDDHAGALAVVDAARTAADRIDPRAWFWAWGTCRSETDLGPGVLGARLPAPAPAVTQRPVRRTASRSRGLAGR